MNKIRPIKNTWDDWLINYILEPIRKSVSRFKDKSISLFEINLPKQTVDGEGKKLNKSKTQKQSEEVDDYYKPTRVSNFWNNNYLKCERDGDKNKKLHLEEYWDKIKHYLRDIIIDLQEADTSKIQLTIAIKFLKKDAKEERSMY